MGLQKLPNRLLRYSTRDLDIQLLDCLPLLSVHTVDMQDPQGPHIFPQDLWRL